MVISFATQETIYLRRRPAVLQNKPSQENSQQSNTGRIPLSIIGTVTGTPGGSNIWLFNDHSFRTYPPTHLE
jgi:hypothetical protein